MDVRDILEKIRDTSPEDAELIAEAYRFAALAHDGQTRFSGEPYFIHPHHVALTLADMGADANTIAAGLLHDVCEDGAATGEDIEKKFGAEIAFLVEGVTKLGTLKYKGEERYAENLRKMIVAMAQDIRVVLIKLADRLHNMKTLEHVPEHKRKRIADETLEIYAPLADRLGMWRLKGIFEDLAFPFSFAEEYRQLLPRVENRISEKEPYLTTIKQKLVDELAKNGVQIVRIDSRVKHLFSLHKKLKQLGDELEEVHDLVAARVIVPTIADCYATLGIIHKLWPPVHGRVKDYIALPKPNGYQSLHTTVFCDGGEITEFQIRTEKMDYEAKHGIAAHWAYAEAGKPKAGAHTSRNLAWVRQISEWQRTVAGSKEFIDSLKLDLFKDRIFVLTPKGDVIDLPEGATPVDFAYHVHSEVGDRCNGAKVNGKMIALDSVLSNGDVCEILTQKNKKPSLSWLDFVKTNYAKGKIRAALKG
ncbi:MAG: RelA/SpoT family protein [Patescibacteria group bacterium]